MDGSRVGLVTGAGSGIGRASALAMAETGAFVICADRDEEAARAAADALKAAGGDAWAVGVDVGSEGQVEAMYASVEHRFGRLDFCLANAGIGSSPGPFEALALEEWNRVLAVNLTGVFLTVRGASRIMVRQGHGRIVTVASITGLVGEPVVASAAYAASKGGVIAMSRQLAVQLAPQGVTVNCVAPGFVHTNIAGGRLFRPEPGSEAAGLKQAIIDHIPLRRFGEAEEIAGVIRFLFSAGAGYLNGAVLVVDGGLTAW